MCVWGGCEFYRVLRSIAIWIDKDDWHDGLGVWGRMEGDHGWARSLSGSLLGGDARDVPGLYVLYGIPVFLALAVFAA